MTDTGDEQPDILGERLVLGRGFTENDRPDIVERLTALGKRLRSYPADSVDLRLSVKNRDRAEQKVTFECRLAGAEPLVATSAEEDLSTALVEVREDMIHQLDKLKTRRDPRHDRPHRP
ncbi:ribosome-associated translation inhibitor RaiA [Streptosporangium album]|uniref:Ribosome-associated translation inhibitor RaiA n=1 Tax=Streptosporangium album TaxID=47479 RepID=A0A7W7RU22_9ACTN|nr:HPF/RaiA family ribosome-associated protein [Streptosporangium album]MBB4937927.1 ribosome-associated translation inhibitor RaiA [Streptosporangium album]